MEGSGVTAPALEALLAAAVAAHRRGRPGDAAARYRSLVDACGPPGAGEHLDVIAAVALGNLGALSLDHGQPAAAAVHLTQAIARQPMMPECHFNLGRARELGGDLGDAVARYTEAHRLAPDNPKFLCQLVHVQMKCCQWADLTARWQLLDEHVSRALADGRPPAESPFKHVARCMDPALNTAVARAWSRSICTRSAKRPPAPPGKARDRLTIGYLSADYHNHATAHLMLGLFGSHDRSRFRVMAYSTGPDDGSRYRQRIRRDCDGFVDVSGLGDGAAAERIAADGVHILVDLKGYTRHHRLGICARRPAPLAVTYLGFPGSTGADFIDYIIADPSIVPPEQAPLYAEQVVTLPHCYQVNDHRQPIARTGMTRADAGLPETAFVFCAFHQAFKIEPVMFDVWMRILNRVPDSVLWLLDNGPDARANLRREAEQRGISANRLIFAPRVDKDIHLERIGLADLGIDTRIYTGHTTTSDALWAGLPVVALRGRHFASRVSASILHAVGLADLLVDRLDEYAQLTTELARSPFLLNRLRHRLSEYRATAPLFDTLRFTRHLEAAFIEMWRRHVNGQPPAPIRIADAGPFFAAREPEVGP